MELKLIILRNNTHLVSLIEQLEYEPRCHLEEPHQITGNKSITLKPWPDYTDDAHIMVYSTELLTICDPTEEIRDKYLLRIGKSLEDLTTETKPDILLTEESPLNVPEEDYEPNYLEEGISY